MKNFFLIASLIVIIDQITKFLFEEKEISTFGICVFKHLIIGVVNNISPIELNLSINILCFLDITK